jgi:carbon-monoxide dehydrogenase medium subunit
MKPSPFAYARPEQLSDVIASLAKWGDDAKVIAGGQSLIPLLNLRLAHPAVLIDISDVERLSGISIEGDEVVIRATTRQREAEHSDELATLCPLIGQALRYVGHAQIRNRGTVGGNLAHGDPASELPAVALALDAEFLSAGPSGKRRIAAADFFVGPYTTALGSDEVLCEIRLPVTTGSGTAFLELARRAGDYALAGVAACIRVDEAGNVDRAALAGCGVDSVPVRLSGAEAAVLGRRLDADALRDAAEAASSEVNPPTDIHADDLYRRRLVGTLVKRAIQVATQ